MSVGVATLIITSPAKQYTTIASQGKTDVWYGYSKLKTICACESRGDKNGEPRQFDNKGDVLRGYPNPNDVGMCQISTEWHAGEAKRVGLDIMTAKGNLAFAKHLYDTEGDAPWKWSKASCWGK